MAAERIGTSDLAGATIEAIADAVPTRRIAAHPCWS